MGGAHAAATDAGGISRCGHRLAGADQLSGLGATTGAAIEEVCCRLTGTEAPIKLAFGTEGGHLAQRRIPTAVCGPGDIQVAHRPDEYVEPTQLERYARFVHEPVHGTVAA